VLPLNPSVARFSLEEQRNSSSPNYSGDFPFVWDELMLPIKYGSDDVLAGQMLQQVAEEIGGDYADGAEAVWTGVVTKFMIEHARVQPAVTLAANQNWIELTLRYVVNYKQRRATKDLLFTPFCTGPTNRRGRSASPRPR
jgi:hypothetical protein